MASAQNGAGASEKQLSVCGMITQAIAKDGEQEVNWKEVSSKALVRSIGQSSPAAFVELEQETNLNLPPNQDLLNEFGGSFTDSPIKRRSIIDVSSFLMAHKYPETVGEVDIISDSEHIKKLLKMPFGSDTELSMVVHRIGRTLLLSDFDVPKLLAHLTAKGYDGLNWLRDFHHKEHGAAQRAHYTSEDSKREQEMLQFLLSAYLQHSAASNIEPNPIDLSVDTLSLESPQPGSELERLFMGKVLSQNDPTGSSSSQSRPEQSFQRDVLWNFEDLTMLVGSNMPILGGGKYPVVSLRMRDASTPINVLTGLDYWLDNLMCNVPEVVMCFHVKGIVKKYEIVKTEDLPALEGGRFCPKMVKDIAQNILSFLRANCTKEGHTYWLFKGGKDDVVKLYDLTSICSQQTNDTSRNPYTLAVGTLLYRLARNMVSKGELTERNVASIKALLFNCLILLDGKTYPELTHAANTLLADIFLSDVYETPSCELVTSQFKIEELDQNEEEPSVQSEDESDRYESDAESTGAKTSENGQFWYSSVQDQEVLSPDMKTLSLEERYRKVVYYLIQALRCQPDTSSLMKAGGMPEAIATSPEDDSRPTDEERSKTESPDLAVDLVFRVRQESPAHRSSQDLWKLDDRATLTLYHKLAKGYTKLAEVHVRKAKYGRALKLLKLALLCQGQWKDASEAEEKILLRAKVLMHVGDIHFFLARCNEDNKLVHKEEFSTYNTDDQFVMSKFGDVESVKKELIAQEPFSLLEERLLLLASDYYERSLELYPDEASDETLSEVIDLTGRLGNVRNELGVYYMNCAANSTRGYGNPQPSEQELWKKSYTYLEKGIKAFEVVSNKQNIALLYSNAGRLMRLCAHVAANGTKSSVDSDRGPFTQEEKMYYDKAFEFYHKAFTTLGVRATSPDIWDKVTDEIGGTYFARASILQDYAPQGSMTEEQVMKDVSSLLMKALQYCEEMRSLSDNVSLQVQKRTGNIHYRIASLYQHWIRYQGSDSLTKKYRTLADKHYEKACAFLTPEKFPCDFIRCLVERNSLRFPAQQQIQKSSLLFKASLASVNCIVTEAVKSALYTVLDTLQVAEQSHAFKERKQQGSASETSQSLLSETFGMDFMDFNRLLDILTMQLCDSLHDIVRLFKNKQNVRVVSQTSLSSSAAKKMYELILRYKMASQTETGGEDVDLLQRCQTLAHTIEELQKARQ